MSADYHSLNAQLNLLLPDGRIDFEADREAVKEYFRQEVEPRSVKFSTFKERLLYLFREGYYEEEVFTVYGWPELERLYEVALAAGHRFESYVGAFKFFQQYALKTFDGERFLESFTDRAYATALYLARGDSRLAEDLLGEILSGRFQPATPTFLNAGKAARGELVSCFLLRVEDNMESIARALHSALQLSKRGGGVAFNLSDLREFGAPIKKIQNQSSGVVPVMKMLEDAFSYANQLGARQGAGAVYLHAHHPDILSFLDTKRENADEKIRIKTLSVGVVVPDITFELAKRNEQMALFSPYDVERVYGVPFTQVSVTEKYDEMVADPRIRKTFINARKLFQTVAELQFESGYPYLMFEDTVNRAHNLKGHITMSNLCSEIVQRQVPSELNPDGSFKTVGEDISCNLGSLNVVKAVEGGDLRKTVETAVRALTAVSDLSDITSVPSIANGNAKSHAIGLGQMNLHAFFAINGVHYGSVESLDLTSAYFQVIAFECLRASNRIAKEKGETFVGFEDSRYADGLFFDEVLSRPLEPVFEVTRRLLGSFIPTREDWLRLKEDVMEYGLYNAYLQAVPPTGSISYVNNSTSSIHPIASRIEVRKEGKMGRVYYPAPYLSNENLEYYADAYEIGPKAIIDVYAAATPWVDQGLSLTLFYPDEATSRDLNRNYIYAWKSGVKTLYYMRVRQKALDGTKVEGTAADLCVSCQL